MELELDQGEVALIDVTLIDEEELAKRTKISQRSWQQWRTTGGGPPFIKATDRCVRYRLKDIQKWLAERTKTSLSEVAVLPGKKTHTK